LFISRHYQLLFVSKIYGDSGIGSYTNVTMSAIRTLVWNMWFLTLRDAQVSQPVGADFISDNIMRSFFPQ
jgi:hypothetical protein